MNLLDIQPTKLSSGLQGVNFLFYGEPGTRKTSVAAQFPDALIAATENGTKFISNAYVQKILTWGDFKNFVRELRTPAVMERYKTIVLDRADTLYDYCYDYCLSALNISDPSELGYGKSWKMIKKEWKTAIGTIEKYGYGIIFICHDKDLLDKKMNYIGTKISMDNSAVSVIRGLVDFTLNLRFDIKDGSKEDTKERTVIAYSQLENVETKSRARYLAPSFEFTYEELEKQFALAIEKQACMEGAQLQTRQRVIEKDRPFDDIKNSVVEKVKHLIEVNSPQLSDLTFLVQAQLGDIKITDADEKYRNQMIVLETFLLSL